MSLKKKTNKTIAHVLNVQLRDRSYCASQCLAIGNKCLHGNFNIKFRPTLNWSFNWGIGLPKPKQMVYSEDMCWQRKFCLRCPPLISSSSESFHSHSTYFSSQCFCFVTTKAQTPIPWKQPVRYVTQHSLCPWNCLAWGFWVESFCPKNRSFSFLFMILLFIHWVLQPSAIEGMKCSSHHMWMGCWAGFFCWSCQTVFKNN